MVYLAYGFHLLYTAPPHVQRLTGDLLNKSLPPATFPDNVSI